MTLFTLLNQTSWTSLTWRTIWTFQTKWTLRILTGPLDFTYPPGLAGPGGPTFQTTLTFTTNWNGGSWADLRTLIIIPDLEDQLELPVPPPVKPIETLGPLKPPRTFRIFSPPTSNVGSFLFLFLTIEHALIHYIFFFSAKLWIDELPQ